MKLGNIFIHEYHWSESKVPGHDFLMKDLTKILEHGKISKEARILDTGCGGGFILNELFKQGYKNLWGFDLSESGIEITRKNFSNIADRVEVHDAYIEKLPEHFPGDGYDLVLSVEVIEHLYSPRTYLNNIHKWLRPGGCLILTTPYHGYLKNLAIALINGFDFHFNPLFEGGHIKFFSKNTITKILTLTNFKPVSFTGSGRLPYLWKSMIVEAEKQGI